MSDMASVLFRFEDYTRPDGENTFDDLEEKEVKAL
jgi:hypothetical protein